MESRITSADVVYVAGNCSNMTTGARANATADRCVPVEYYEPTLSVVGTLLVGVIFVAGLVGNAAVVAVVARTRSLRTPTGWYLVSLAVADAVWLVASAPQRLVMFQTVVNRWPLGGAGCSPTVWARCIGINVSSLCIVAVTVDR